MGPLDVCVCASLAVLPGETALSAMRRVREGLDEPLWGRLSSQHVQLVPQSREALDEETALALMTQYKATTTFRLHANVRLAYAPWSPVIDASTAIEYASYYRRLKEANAWVRGDAYTWHAGLRRHATLEQVLDRTRALEDALGVPVGIEGMYPTRSDLYLLSNWEEYQILLRSGVRYALDLSHLNIVREKFGPRDILVRELLASPACMEIHVSGNDGSADQHGQLANPPWWYDMLRVRHPVAVVFSEGNQRKGLIF